MATYDVVYLDLEETVINNWQEQFLVHTYDVRKWLREHDVAEVGIFSFAIHNSIDKVLFEKSLKADLERALEVKIVKWPSVIEMMEDDTRHTGDHWFQNDSPGFAVTEYINTRGKQNAFINYVDYRHEDAKNAVLLDDVVRNMTLTYHDLERSIHLVNVMSI